MFRFDMMFVVGTKLAIDKINHEHVCIRGVVTSDFLYENVYVEQVCW